MQKADNLYSRKGIWYARVYVKGEEYRRSLSTRIKSEAKSRLKEFREKLESDLQREDSPRKSYQVAVVQYIQDGIPKLEVSDKTANRYVCSLRALDPFFADATLDQITRSALHTFVRERRRTVTNATIKRDLTALSSVLKFCLQHEWIEYNVAAQYDSSFIKERRDPIVLPTLNAINLALDNLPPSLERPARLLRHTGMRQGEATNLDRHHIDDLCRCTIVKAKRRKTRVIKLNDAAIGTVTGTVPYSGSRVLFWENEGERIKGMSKRFSYYTLQTAKQHADFRRFRCHDLRHFFAVEYLRNKTGSIYDLQKHLGHSSIKTTELYLDYLTPEEQKEIMLVA